MKTYLLFDYIAHFSADAFCFFIHEFWNWPVLQSQSFSSLTFLHRKPKTCVSLSLLLIFQTVFAMLEILIACDFWTHVRSQIKKFFVWDFYECVKFLKYLHKYFFPHIINNNNFPVRTFFKIDCVLNVTPSFFFFWFNARDYFYTLSLRKTVVYYLKVSINFHRWHIFEC